MSWPAGWVMLADTLGWVSRIYGHVRGGGASCLFGPPLLTKYSGPPPPIRIDPSLTDYFIYMNIWLFKFNLMIFIGSLIGYIISKVDSKCLSTF